VSDRETIDAALGYPEAGDPRHLYASGPQGHYDEAGSFAVGMVFRDAVERVESRWDSLRSALKRADAYRDELAEKGYDRHRVVVHVYDEDDGERGYLTWDHLEED
jgi:hypothetical protein